MREKMVEKMAEKMTENILEKIVSSATKLEDYENHPEEYFFQDEDFIISYDSLTLECEKALVEILTKFFKKEKEEKL